MTHIYCGEHFWICDDHEPCHAVEAPAAAGLEDVPCTSPPTETRDCTTGSCLDCGAEFVGYHVCPGLPGEGRF